MKKITGYNYSLFVMAFLPLALLSAKSDWIADHSFNVPFFSHRPYKLFVDSENNKIGGLLQDAVFTYSLTDKTVQKTPINRLPYPSARTIFDPIHRKIHAYYSGNGPVSTWVEGKQYFEPIHSVELNKRTHFGHASFVDTSGNIYTLGGSEDHSFTNDFRQYDFSTHTWDQIALKGPAFFPRRHMAICPAGEPNKFYIFGGEGNESGEKGKPFAQLPELWLLDLNEKEINLVWTYNPIERPFTPFGIAFHKQSQSLYILHSVDQPGNTKTQKWQLIHSPMDEPNFTTLGSPIESASIISNPLFFSTDSTDLLCMTFDPAMVAKPETIPIRILGFPIHPVVAKTNLMPIIFGLVVFAGVSIIFFVYYKRTPNKVPVDGSLSVIIEDSKASSIDFFGEFYALDQDEKNVSSAFTPKLKELFFLIFFHSFPIQSGSRQKGISTQKVSHTLWPKSSPKSVKNQRSIAISRLRDILKNFPSLQLTFDNKFWTLTIDGYISSDYFTIIQYLDRPSLSKNDLMDVSRILQKGQFLEGIDFHWLDPIKEEMISKALYFLVESQKRDTVKNDSQLMLQISNAMLTQDALSEKGILMKVESLKSAGQLAQAKAAFDHYVSTYEDISGHTYPKSFQDII